MAKLTIDEAKAKLAEIEKAVTFLKQAGIAIPASTQAEFDRYTKAITGNTSQQLANTFNEKLGSQINAHPEFVELLAGQIGTKARLTVLVKVAEDGTKSIVFEGGSAGGGQKAGTSTNGGTKSATAYNCYEVNVIGDLPAYKEKSGKFETAAGAVAFILNNGNNPLNLGAEYGKGNSMVRVLVGTTGIGGMSASEAFKANFTLKCSYVAVEPKAAEPVAEVAGA